VQLGRRLGRSPPSRLPTLGCQRGIGGSPEGPIEAYLPDFCSSPLLLLSWSLRRATACALGPKVPMSWRYARYGARSAGKLGQVGLDELRHGGHVGTWGTPRPGPDCRAVALDRVRAGTDMAVGPRAGGCGGRRRRRRTSGPGRMFLIARGDSGIPRLGSGAITTDTSLGRP
jgi:hypothetical protein